jgi:hypothetical protein
MRGSVLEDRFYARQYNEHRLHGALAQRPSLAKPPPIREAAPSAELLLFDRVGRRGLIGGLL